MSIGNSLNINFTANQLVYASGASTLSGLTTGNNSVLVTSAGGVPSISATLPIAVQQNITELGTIIAANKELLAKAPKGKEGKAAVEAIGQEIADDETVSTEVTAGVTNNEDILTLSGKIKPAVEKAKAISTELTEVIEKAKSKGGKKAKK